MILYYNNLFSVISASAHGQHLNAMDGPWTTLISRCVCLPFFRYRPFVTSKIFSAAMSLIHFITVIVEIGGNNTYLRWLGATVSLRTCCVFVEFTVYVVLFLTSSCLSLLGL